MESFMSKLSDSNKRIYQKVALISSLHEQIFNKSKHNPVLKSSKITIYLDNQDLLNICKYSNPLIAPISPIVQQKIDNQKFTDQKNSCFHIAAQYGNIHMVRHLVRHYNKLNPQLIESQSARISNLANERINEKNLNGDTPLIHCLKVNSDYKMEKIVTYLSRYSDLSVRDRLNKLPFEVNLPVYNVSKVRVLDILREKYENLGK